MMCLWDPVSHLPSNPILKKLVVSYPAPSHFTCLTQD